MVRTILGFGVVVGLLTMAGCTMCCHPNDYAGPVYHRHGCSGCSSCSSNGGRAGSILTDSQEATMEMAPEMSRRPTVKKVAQAKKVQSRSGSVQNRTVQSRMRQRPTDSSPSQSGVAVQGEGTLSQSEVQRRVREDIRPGDVPDSAKIVSVTDRVVGESEGSGETTSLAEGSSSDEPQSLPSKGWVARRPTPEIVR